MSSKSTALCLVAALVIAGSVDLHAQTPARANAATVLSTEMPNHFDPAAATRAWLATVPKDERAKSDAYFEGGYWLLLWNFLLTVAIAVFLLVSRISARLRDLAERITTFKSAQLVLYAIPCLLIAWVLSLPLNVS